MIDNNILTELNNINETLIKKLNINEIYKDNKNYIRLINRILFEISNCQCFSFEFMELKNKIFSIVEKEI